ncbi:MAG: alpha/beta hydrolase, partial [Acidimicrobiia bacterium]|nr:alpha/beta hydrolase [Acidimicrobiia bacterium]
MSRLFATLCFVWFGAACVWTWNALRRPVPPGKRFPPLWLPAMIVSELSPVFFVLRVATALVFVALGVTDFLVGRLGIWLFAISQLGLLVVIARNIRSGMATGHAPSIWSILKVTERLPDGVEHAEGVPYWDDFTMNVYRRADAEAAPALIYTHPGSWMRGRPGRQARAMFHRLAARGWVVLDIRYPLSPAATFPDHVVGVKRAIEWAKHEGR